MSLAYNGHIRVYLIVVFGVIDTERYKVTGDLTLLRCHRKSNVTGVVGSFQTPNASMTSLPAWFRKNEAGLIFP